jgi:hypothetical protein
MNNAFILLEIQFQFPGVNSNLLIAKAIEHSTCVSEKLWVRLAVDEYIVDVDLAYFVDLAVKDLVLYTALTPQYLHSTYSE